MPAGNPMGYFQQSDPELDAMLPTGYRQNRAALAGAGQETPLAPMPAGVPTQPASQQLNALSQQNQAARGEQPTTVNADVDQISILGRILQALGVI